MVPEPSALGGEVWPAPSHVLWTGVSRVFAGGLSALPAEAQSTVVVGLLLGLPLAVMKKEDAPKHLRAYVP